MPSGCLHDRHDMSAAGVQRHTIGVSRQTPTGIYVLSVNAIFIDVFTLLITLTAHERCRAWMVMLHGAVGL